jgi:hypothetical protein
MNELPETVRTTFENVLTRLALDGVSVLILEPIARHAVPWWDATADRLGRTGFRADEWRFAIDRPPIVKKLDQATGLNHTTVTLRSLYHP